MEKSIWTIMAIILGLVTVIVILVVVSRAFMQTHVGAEKHIEDSGKGTGCVIACQICCMNSSAVDCGDTGGSSPEIDVCHCQDTKPSEYGC